MSVAATTAVWKLAETDDQLKTRHIAVLMVLADAAGDDIHAWPSTKKIGKRLAMSRSTVIRALNELIKMGAIDRLEWYRDDGSQSTSVYRLLFVAALGFTKTTHKKVPREMGFGKVKKAGVFKITDENRRGVNLTQAGCQFDTGEGVNLIPQETNIETNLLPNTSINTSIEKNSTPKESSNDDVYWKIIEAWNENCGSLSKVKALNTARKRQLKTLIKDLGSPQEAYAVMAIAAKEVSMDPFWQQRGLGFNNILADQRVVQKAENAYNRGSFDHDQAEIDRMLAAIGGNDA